MDKDLTTRLEELMELKKAIEEEEVQIRKDIMSFIGKGKSIILGKYVASKVIPKDTEVFNSDDFILNESDEIIEAVSTLEITTDFDEERFAIEHDELYKQYLSTHEKIIVNTDLLKKYKKELYDKYTKVTKSTKEVTLRIAENKEKKKKEK